MSTYIDPSTALSLAREARAEEIRQAERYHLARAARMHDDPGETPRPRRRRRSLRWVRATVAH
jgi:hypothetical protein